MAVIPPGPPPTIPHIRTTSSMTQDGGPQPSLAKPSAFLLGKSHGWAKGRTDGQHTRVDPHNKDTTPETDRGRLEPRTMHRPH
eukprot:15432076-Alexandrium_andersonii.AAC.1